MILGSAIGSLKEPGIGAAIGALIGIILMLLATFGKIKSRSENGVDSITLEPDPDWINYFAFSILIVFTFSFAAVFLGIVIHNIPFLKEAVALSTSADSGKEMVRSYRP